MDVIDAISVTVTSLVYITDFSLQGTNLSSNAFTEYIGIYSDSGGAPGTLIASSSSSLAPSASNPVITFSSPVPLFPGVYWFAADSDNNAGGEVTNPGFGVELIIAQTNGAYTESNSTGDPIPMPASLSSLGVSTNEYEPCISADWTCP